MVKVTTIVENHSNSLLGIPGEHGISMRIEYKGRNILFDTGQTGLFLDNADKMNIDLSKIQDIILSHGHYDHTGGLKSYLTKHYNKSIFVGKSFFNKKFKKNRDGTIVYNGNPFLSPDTTEKIEPANVSIIKESNSTLNIINNSMHKLDDGLWLVRDFEMKNNFEKLDKRFFIGRDSDYYLDRFTDEMVLCIETSKGLVLIVGCSHVGIINIVENVTQRFKDQPIRGIIGGIHLINAKEERVKHTLEELLKLNLEFLALSHCTGDENIKRIKEIFKDCFIMNITGNRIEFSK